MEFPDEQMKFKMPGEEYATEKGDNGHANLPAAAWTFGYSINITKKDWFELALCENDLDEMKNYELLYSGEHCKPEMQQNRILTIQSADNAIATINETLA